MDLLSEKIERRTKLFQAVLENNFLEVQKLIELSKTLNIEEKMVNLPDCQGRTPLYRASFQGYLDIVSLLLNSKANIDQANKNGATPLFVASQQNQIDAVQILLNNDADIYKAHNDGTTPAYAATEKGHEYVLRQLLNKGYKTDHKSFEGLTILHGASSLNHHAIVEMLLTEFNAKDMIDDASNEYKFTPLTMAVSHNGDLDMVKLLVEAGANKNKESYGKTPLRWALEKGKTQILEYLQN